MLHWSIAMWSNSNHIVGATDRDWSHQWVADVACLRWGTKRNPLWAGWHEGFNPIHKEYLIWCSKPRAKATTRVLWCFVDVKPMGRNRQRSERWSVRLHIVEMQMRCRTGYGFKPIQRRLYACLCWENSMRWSEWLCAMKNITTPGLFKHPSPWDYMFLMNQGSGSKNLEWFWYYWLIPPPNTVQMDLSLDVQSQNWNYKVTVKQAGEMPSPWCSEWIWVRRSCDQIALNAKWLIAYDMPNRLGQYRFGCSGSRTYERLMDFGESKNQENPRLIRMEDPG